MKNEDKAKMIAEQCKPCTDDFYSGIYQGVLLALNVKEKEKDLKSMSKDEVMSFIRKRLCFDEGTLSSLHLSLEEIEKLHRRFEMSGYEGKTGQCTLWNTSILNEFADLGIYDYTHYLFLDFYKGTPTLYLKYFNEEENLEHTFEGSGTTEIIYTIFELTIFSGKPKRRRF